MARQTSDTTGALELGEKRHSAISPVLPAENGPLCVGAKLALVGAATKTVELEVAASRNTVEPEATSEARPVEAAPVM